MSRNAKAIYRCHILLNFPIAFTELANIQLYAVRLDIKQIEYTLARHSRKDGIFSPFQTLAREIESTVIRLIKMSIYNTIQNINPAKEKHLESKWYHPFKTIWNLLMYAKTFVNFLTNMHPVRRAANHT